MSQGAKPNLYDFAMPATAYPSAPCRRRRRGFVLPLCATLLMTSLGLIDPALGASAGVAPAASACSPPQHIPSSLGWPGASWKDCVEGPIAQSSPTVATYDGKTIVAVGDEDGYLHVLDAATGAELPGWPQKVNDPGGGRVAIESSPAIGYLHGPNRPPSIVVGVGSTWVTSSVGEVEAFALDGAPQWTFTVGKAANAAAGVISSPAIGDVTGSGTQVVFGAWDHKVYVVSSSGHQLGFAYDNADTIWSSPALYQLPGQRVDEIFIGSDASGRPYTTPSGSPAHCVGGFLTAFRFTNDAIDPDTLQHGPGLTREWFHCLGQSIWSSPAVGVLSDAGVPAVVVGTGYFEQPFPGATDRIFAFNALSGAPLKGWPVRTPGPTYGSPAIGPVDGSGTNAVVDVSWSCNAPYQKDCFYKNVSSVVAYSATGKRLWHDELPGPTALGSPILAPLEGEATNDVLVGTPNGVYPIAGSTGALLFGTNATNQFAAIDNGCRVFDTPAVAEVTRGSTSSWELIDACGGPAPFNTPGEIAAYRLPVQPTTAPAWPMFRQGAAHLGVAAGTPSG